MPVSDGKIPKVAKSARDRTLVVRLLAFREFVTDYFIGATLSATVTIINDRAGNLAFMAESDCPSITGWGGASVPFDLRPAR